MFKVVEKLLSIVPVKAEAGFTNTKNIEIQDTMIKQNRL